MRCPLCQKLFTNKTVHMAHCHKTKKADERNEKRVRKIVEDKNSRAFKGADKVIQALKKWAKDNHVRMGEHSSKKYAQYS